MKYWNDGVKNAMAEDDRDNKKQWRLVCEKTALKNLAHMYTGWKQQETMGSVYGHTKIARTVTCSLLKINSNVILPKINTYSTLKDQLGFEDGYNSLSARLITVVYWWSKIALESLGLSVRELNEEL